MINLFLKGDISALEEGLAILAPRIGVALSSDGIPVNVTKQAKGLSIKYKDGTGNIAYGEPTDFYRALAILADSIKKNEDIDIAEQRQFDTCGTMIDVSRGFVYKKETVCDLIEQMALMGINMFMLYTEDTYELEKYPWFGYLRGAYTKAELKAIDDHAYKLGIEVIPCIQTLAHLAKTLRWPAMNKVKDTSDVLLVGEDATYELIEDMIKTQRECFRSNRIHIGFDEAFGIGTGRYLENNKPKNPKELIMYHLKKVCKIVKKYNYHPMIWSDMFFRFGKEQGEYSLGAEIPESLATDLPQDIELIYWDYIMENDVLNDSVIKMHNEMERPVGFAGGIWTWNCLSACYKKSYDTARHQLKACAKNNLSTVFTTVWNNEKSYSDVYTILPALQAWAELCYDVDADETKIAKRFAACTGYKFNEWKLLSGDDYTDEERAELNPKGHFRINTTFQFFFNDILCGLLDKTLSGYDFKSRYQKFIEDIEKVDAGDKQRVFDRQKTLYKICHHKADIASRIREAYFYGDKSEISALVEELKALRELYRDYMRLTRDMWYTECKPFGNVRMEAELGGAAERVDCAIYRLESYLAGSADSLDELEAEIFYYKDIQKPLIEIVTPMQILI